MKKISAIITALVTGAALTGCTFGASIDTLMAPPKLGAEQEDIYNALTKAEGTSISLKYPKSGKYLSAFIIEDIDGDGGDEALVFYERNNHAADENPLRMNILDKKDGKWCSVRDKATAGSEIEEVIISRLGSNKRINLIVGTSILNRSEKNVSIYNYSGGKLTEANFSEPYSFIDVKDLDMDNEYEFLRLTKASNGAPALAEAYKLDENGMYRRLPKLDESGELISEPLELGDNVSDFDVSYGKLPNGRTGMYLDAVSGTGSIQSAVLYMEGNALAKVFDAPAEEGEEAPLRPAGCSSFDVDGDGSLEIPVQVVAPGYETAAEGEQQKLTEWMKLDENMELKRRYTSYYSLNDGYIFIFPERWAGKVTLRLDTVNDEIVFCTSDNTGSGRELLRIFCAEDAPSREDRISGGYMLMHTKGESSYLALIPAGSRSGSDGLGITAGELALGFRYRD
jgi:hypothetical protein